MFRSISRGTLSAILACVLAASLILMPLQFAFAAYSYGETEKDSLPVNGDVSGESDAGIVADDEAENSSVAEDMVSDFDGDVVRGAEMLSGENGITATLADSPLVAQADNDISNAHCFLIDPFRGAVNAINLRLILDGRALSLNKDYEITGCVDDKGNPVTQISEAGFYTFSYRGIGSYTGTGSIRLENYDMAPIGNFNDAYIADCNLVYTGSPQPIEFEVTLGSKRLEQGVDYTVDYIKKNGTEISPDEVIEVGSYEAMLTGVEGRGYTGSQTISISVYNSYDLVAARVEGYDLKDSYDWTGQAIHIPDFTLTMPNGTELVEGIDYTVQVSGGGQTVDKANAQCIDEGRYYVQAIGIGSYAAGYKTKVIGSFLISKPEYNLANATVSGVKIRYAFTGLPVDISPIVMMGSKQLNVDVDGSNRNDADCSLVIRRFLSAQGVWSLKDIYFPGHYYIFLNNANNGYMGTNTVAEFYIYEEDEGGIPAPDAPVAEDESTGVTMTASLLDDMVVDGNTVRFNVSDDRSSASPEATSVLEKYTTADDALAKVFNVTLDLLNSSGEHIASLTEDLGSVALAFPVDTSLNGKNVKVIQLHEKSDGSIEQIENVVTVANGQAKVIVDKLSEFIIVPMDEKSENPSAGEDIDSDEGAGDDKGNVSSGGDDPSNPNQSTGEGSSAAENADQTDNQGFSTSMGDVSISIQLLFGVLVAAMLVLFTLVACSRKQSGRR